MDILYFFRERTKLIRYYYGVSAGAFLELQRKIEAAEPPFDDPPYDESGEPPYLEEWSDAARGVILAGRSCISMLASAMDLYFRAWERDLEISYGPGDQKKLFENGKIRGYQQVFEHFTKISWENSGINPDLLEQVVLARNADQHGGDLTSIRVHCQRDDHRGIVRIDPCRFEAALDMQTLVCTRGRDSPLVPGAIPVFISQTYRRGA